MTISEMANYCYQLAIIILLGGSRALLLTLPSIGPRSGGRGRPRPSHHHLPFDDGA